MEGEKHLLTIGITEYNTAVWPRLPNAASDALRISKILEEKYGFVKVHPHVLNENATRAKMLAAFRELSSSSIHGDDVIILYSGHGGIQGKSKKGYWVPWDAQSDIASAVSHSDVLDAIDEIEARHILLISDSCYSGTLITRSRSGLVSELTIEELEAKDSRWILTAGLEETVSDGKVGVGSPFANALCEALETNDSVALPFFELYEKVFRETLRLSSHRQTPNADYIRRPEHCGGQMVFRLRNTTGVKAVEVERVPLSVPVLPMEYYIPRTLSNQNELESYWSFSVAYEESSTYLYELLQTEKRLVILGSAGSGKSVELIHAANRLVKETENFTPVYKRFNTYVDERIEDYLPEGWGQISPTDCVIFLDGLDEVQSQHLHTAVRRILKFAGDNPDIRIVISCRSNFYELPTKDFGGTLEGFGVYNLNDVSQKEIKDYSTTHMGVDGQKLIEDAFSVALGDLIQKPFFLPFLLQQYKETGGFRTSRVDTIREAMGELLSRNKQHYATTARLDRSVIFAMLEKVAFVMERMGKNFITDEELAKVFTDKDELNSCKFLPAFNHDDVRHQWMFVHNNIQEYLASNVLSKEPIDKIVSIISISTGGEQKVRATWVNTISFLVSTGDSRIVQPLLEWIIQHDREVVVKFEADRLSKVTRIEIFKQIFEHYSAQLIWLSSNKFSDEDLARFGYFEKILEFLTNKLEDGNSDRVVKFNAIRIIERFKLANFREHEARIRTALFRLLKTDISDQDAYSILNTVARLKFLDKEAIDFIKTRFGNSRNQYIRAGMYYALHNSEFLDENISIFLQGLSLNDVGLTGKREDVHLLSEDIHLKEGLTLVNSPDAIEAVFNKLKGGVAVLYGDDEETIVGSLIPKASALFNPENTIYQSVLELYYAYVNRYENRVVAKILPFFTDTKTATRAALETLRGEGIEEYLQGDAIGFLLDDDVLKHLIAEFKADHLTQAQIEKVHQILFWKRGNDDGIDAILTSIEQVSEETGTAIVRPKLRDGQANRQRWMQNNFDMLFDKEALANQIKQLFERFDEKAVDKEYLLEFAKEARRDNYYVLNQAFELLREHAFAGGKLQLEDILNWISSSPGFEDFRISHIYSALRNNNEVNVSSSQISAIEAWCNEHTQSASIIWFFLHQFKIHLAEDKLLSLSLYFDSSVESDIKEAGTIEMLWPYINRSILDKRVESNIVADDIGVLSWVSNAGYALRNNIGQSFERIISTVENNEQPEYKFSELLELWFSKTQDQKRLEKITVNAPMPGLRTKAIDLLIQSGQSQDFVLNHLNDLVNDEKQPLPWRLDAAHRLVQLGDLKGFDFIADQIIKKTDGGDWFYMSYGHSISGIENLNALPKLMELLLVAKQSKVQERDYEFLESAILNAILNIGVKSEDNLIAVKSAISDFIASNNSRLPDLNFLNTYVSRIEEQFNLQKSQMVSVEEAIAEYGQLSIGTR